MAHDDKLIKELEEKANIVRHNIFRIFDSSHGGHCGGTMSLIELVTALYFHHLRLEYGNYDWPERDRVILSKAHCCEAIYAILPEIGYVPEEALDTYYCFASPFQGHADRWCERIPSADIPAPVCRAAAMYSQRYAERTSRKSTCEAEVQNLVGRVGRQKIALESD